MMADAKTFDLEKVYDKKIAPLMTQIIEACKEHHLPMFATFLYRADPEGIDDGEDGYCTTQLFFDDHQMTGEMKQLQKCLEPRRRIISRLTTRDGNGNVTDTVIL